MLISEEGVKAIREREGFRTRAYQDTRGIWTIGVGHTGPEVHVGLVWTEDQVDATLKHDLERFENAINELVHVPISQNQFNALVSFVFNIGIHAFTGSTVLHMLNQKRYGNAADAFLMWEKPPELKRRRESERTQFIQPDNLGIFS